LIGKYVKRIGNVAIVVLNSEIPKRALMVNAAVVSDVKKGQEFQISQKIVSTGTEYSLDWDLIIPDGLQISSQELQNALIDRGIFTIEDYWNNQNIVNDAITVLVGKLRIEMAQHVKFMFGG
jgi:hypothetical protein